MLIVGCFFLLAAGCTFQQLDAEETLARPDILWKTTWLIEERQARIDLSTEDAFLEASCLINYQGEETVEDVRVAMASPLTDVLIAEDLAKTFSVVKPGDKLKFSFDTVYPHWKKKVPTAILTEKIIDDFNNNSYVSVCWKGDEDEHCVKFFTFGE